MSDYVYIQIGFFAKNGHAKGRIDGHVEEKIEYIKSVLYFPIVGYKKQQQDPSPDLCLHFSSIDPILCCHHLNYSGVVSRGHFIDNVYVATGEGEIEKIFVIELDYFSDYSIEYLVDRIYKVFQPDRLSAACFSRIRREGILWTYDSSGHVLEMELEGEKYHALRLDKNLPIDWFGEEELHYLGCELYAIEEEITEDEVQLGREREW